MTNPGTTRWNFRPSWKWLRASATKLFTLRGASFGSRQRTITPRPVVIVAAYSLVVSICIGGAAEYTCTFEGWLRGASAAPNR